ncbi:MAG: hypothetical protein IT454_19995 [Planctomycetes bacterium]|nr:hypothetical protein [Planctomycetota bacterium]
MRCSLSLARICSSRSARFALVFCGISAAVAAEQILEAYSASLTTYLAGKTGVQDSKPRPEQRAVGLDGSGRAGSTHGIAIAGNPFESAWRGETSVNGVQLDTGTWTTNDVDLAFPADVPWRIGRSFGARQTHSGAQYDSDGPAGRNWHASSMPEIVLYDDADNSKDVLYLVLGADRYVEYQRKGSSSSEFKGKNGAAGLFLEVSGSPTIYRLLDQRGWTFEFFGFNTGVAGADGLLWRSINPNSDKAYVGDATTASTAVTNGFSGGHLVYAFDSSDRRYTYSWNSDSTPHISQVKVETKTGGTWFSSPTGVTEVGKVDYTYYGDESFGDPGDLKTAKVTLPLTDSGISDIRTTYYRYWEGTFDTTTNPGHPHALKLVVGAEGTRKYDWTDSTFDDDFLTETTDNLKPYAAAYFQYDSSHRVNKGWFNGQCGCSGAGSGEFEFRYETSGYTDTANYDTAWARRTSVERPDGSWMTQYFDEVGQPLHHVITDSDPSGSPTGRWVVNVTRDSNGCVTAVGQPNNLNTGTYSHSTGTIQSSTSAGLVRTFGRVSTGSDLIGFVGAEHFKTAGSSSSAYYDRTLSYAMPTQTISGGSSAVTRPLVAADKRYATAATVLEASEERYDSATSSTVSSAITVVQQDVEHLAISTTSLGSGSADTDKTHLTLAGHVDYAKTDDGVVTYREYTNGQLTKEIDDANTGSLSEPDGFSHAGSGTPAHLVTEHAYDAQGRRTTTTLPDGRVTQNYYTRLADRRLVVLSFPKYASGSGTRYGPVSYSVTNQAGRAEVSGVIALTNNESTSALTAFIDETDADAITAVDVGTVAKLSTSVLDSSGTQVSEERTYFSIPSSLPGTDGTHYDPTKYGYDSLGRKWRLKNAAGTIQRTVYDARGLRSASWKGTNDSSFSGGESGTDNMVKTEAFEYDSGSSGGNGHLTKRTVFDDSTGTDKSETQFKLDVRGRVIAVINPTSPHTVNAYDNLGRVTATAQYSSSSGLSETSAPTTATNRIALSETAFDERGQAWKTVRHKIDAADGSDDDSLESKSWRDSEGRVIKQDGEQLSKTRFDRLGRTTHRFVLANDNDSAYADADDVTGDVVLEEHQTTFDSYGKVVMEATIARHHDDIGGSQTTGVLDTNADGGTPDPLAYTAADIKGRIQINATWYDAFDRVADTVQFGTYSGSTFDRDGMSVPSRSTTALRTTNDYNTDGTLKQVTDPKGLVTRYEYNAAGRRTKVIANYVDGTPGGGSDNDQDQVVSYAYTDGLQVSITADLPSGETDQVTTYAFGTTKGTSAGDSKVATGDLLHIVTYPDSGGSSDVVTFAYNAQGQEVWKQDQAGNVIETTYDDAGRQSARAVTTLASGFDGAVRRIATTYDSLGRTQLVTQYDAASAGNVVDEVKNVYDGWGNLTNFQQDRDSTVGASGYKEVAYAYAKATTGRNTLRRTSQTLPNGDVYNFAYSSTGGLLDADASRVMQIQNSSNTALVTYDYNGTGQVVRTYYEEPDVMWKLAGSSSGSYPDLDAFNRVAVSKWTKDLSTDRDFYNVTLSYDENSNITAQDDSVHSGHDVKYSNDNLNRLIAADEGTLASGSITSRKRKQEWALNQTGNWNTDKVDLNGDADYADAGELNDTRAHNAVNELTSRDTNSTSPAEYNFTYDAAGNMTDDGELYTYEWDAFYRLRKVRNRGDASLISEYWYNGLGFLITRHQDTNRSGTVTSDDKKYHTFYDERWRPVATYRGADTDAKEQFVYHCAGDDGYGGSSYIDACVLRDKDASTAWTSASDGGFDERVYYCQNWRADVVAIVSSAGELWEWAKYSAYGAPFGMPAGDCDSDGDCDSADATTLAGWIGGSYDVRGDLDLNGAVETADQSLQSNYSGTSLGRGVLTNVDNRKGYAGYEVDWERARDYLVRSRIFGTTLGRWTSRDPLDAMLQLRNQLEYVGSEPLTAADPTGLVTLSRPRTSVKKTTCNPSESGTGAVLADKCEIRCQYQYQPPTTGPAKKVPSGTHGAPPVSVVGFIVTEIFAYIHDCRCPESGSGTCISNSEHVIELTPVLQNMPLSSPDLTENAGITGRGFGWGGVSLYPSYYPLASMPPTLAPYFQTATLNDTFGPYYHKMAPGESLPTWWKNPHDTFPHILAVGHWECCPNPYCHTDCSK